MTFSNELAFIAAMLALAAMPSASVLLVVARSSTHGFRNGLVVVAGIVVGDLIYLAIAMSGMSVLAELLGGFFTVIRYIGGLYLVWLGCSLLAPGIARHQNSKRTDDVGSTATGFSAGLFLTLGDIKAILFYASLLPNLFDLGSTSQSTVVFVVVATILSVGGVKSLYAFGADRLMDRSSNLLRDRRPRSFIGLLLAGTGGYLIAKS